MAGEKILVVEDNKDLLQVLNEVLNRDGYQTVFARSGKDALEMARTELPNLVILDLRIPEPDGFEVTAVLKDNFRTAHIPILMITGVWLEIENKVKGLHIGADDYIIKPFDNQELLARVEATLRREHIARDSNPLTELPGNKAIAREIDRRLTKKEPLAILYNDLDNFKPFNDYYGYSRGDIAIKEIADLISSSVEEFGNQEDFIGHIGGDDFIIITTPDRIEPVSTKIFDGLTEISSRLYKEEDVLKGYFEVEDRRGEIRRFTPRFRMTIAGVTNLKIDFESHLQVSDRLAELKHFGKAQGGDILVVDRRE